MLPRGSQAGLAAPPGGIAGPGRLAAELSRNVGLGREGLHSLSQSFPGLLDVVQDRLPSRGVAGRPGRRLRVCHRWALSLIV
jgi:hypothetical protein